MVMVGTAILWFGWFGFNAGSALGANGAAANAFLTTNLAAAAAGLSWALIEWRHNGAPTMLGVATGAVAGLVAITPACGFVGPMAAIVIGIMVSVLGFIAVAFIKPRLGYDDSLDVFGVHGVGGMWGAIATGIFAQASIGGTNGILFGNPRQFLIQLAGVAATIIYSGALTFALFKLVDATIGMRVSEDDEVVGLDISQHREAGYTVLE
jgi:Amt family ammonium transporter